MTTLVDLILVERLRRVYWPQEIFEMYRLERVLRTQPVDFVPEDNAKRRSDLYDLGRVHYFYKKLRGGGSVDPICVETEVPFGSRLGSPTSWGPPVIDDGHHRFAAAVLARKRRIPASFGGVVEQLEWLTGVRPFRSLPVGVEGLGT